MKFEIDRSKWRAGGRGIEGAYCGVGRTSLLNSEGYMCCLGQILSQVGVPDKFLLDRDTPGDVIKHVPEDGEFLVCQNDRHKNSPLSDLAMEINDDRYMNLRVKEAELISLFGEHGHELVFVGEYSVAGLPE